MMMPVTDEQIAWLRAYLVGDMETVKQVAPEAAAPQAATGLDTLVFAAFVIAARKRFAPTWSHAKVNKFVAEVRALLAEQPDIIDPITAENQLRNALGEQMTDRPDPAERARAQLILLSFLVESDSRADAELNVLLAEARKEADDLLSGTS